MNKEMWKILKDAEDEIEEEESEYVDYLDDNTDNNYFGYWFDVEAIESISIIDECDKLIRHWGNDYRGIPVERLKSRLHKYLTESYTIFWECDMVNDTVVAQRYIVFNRKD